MKAAALLLALALAACGNADSDDGNSDSPPEPIVLTKSGACGDAFFWAESESGEIAVTVYVEAWPRSEDAPTTIPIALPDPAIEVEVLTGHNLARNFCTDLPDTSSYPISTMSAVAGTGEITLDAALPLTEACGSTSGTLRLDGLTTGNGTVFAPIDVTSEMIGCYSG